MIANLREYIKSGALGGFLIFLGVLLAMIISNTALYEIYYKEIVYLPIVLKLGSFDVNTDLQKLVNDGLMALFFLLIGLDMKYQLAEGEYKEKRKVLLPAAAAIGGLVVPVSIYSYFNIGQSTMVGWAIPIATDTAFILGILAFFGRKISISLKVFMIGFSIIDDAAAIATLAIFYTDSLNAVAFGLSMVCILVLLIMNYMNISKIKYYLAVGLVLWVLVVESNVHGTLAGIILALFIPSKLNNSNFSPLKTLEMKLHPIVYYFILPIFAFINTEVPFKYMSVEGLSSNLSLGIILGLVLGKPIGIICFSLIITTFKIAKLPENTNWVKFIGVAMLGGIGFTLSLFIGTIAFDDFASINNMRVAVILGSFLSALLGSILLKFIK